MTGWFARFEDMLGVIVVAAIILISIISNIISAQKKRQQQRARRAVNTEGVGPTPSAQQPKAQRPQPPDLAPLLQQRSMDSRTQQPAPGRSFRESQGIPDLREIAQELFGIPAPPKKEPEPPVEIELLPPPEPKRRPPPRRAKPAPRRKPKHARVPILQQGALSDMSTKELRQAVVLAEVLGPPLAKRRQRKLF